MKEVQWSSHYHRHQLRLQRHCSLLHVVLGRQWPTVAEESLAEEGGEDVGAEEEEGEGGGKDIMKDLVVRYAVNL